jgi:hypothetical protein
MSDIGTAAAEPPEGARFLPFFGKLWLVGNCATLRGG